MQMLKDAGRSYILTSVCTTLTTVTYVTCELTDLTIIYLPSLSKSISCK